MTKEDLELFLEEQGWNLFTRKRHGGRHKYYYANRWRAGEIYICPLHGLGGIAREAILEKIQEKVKISYQ